MAKIQNIEEPWEGHTHQEVEEFVKGQFGEITGGKINTLSVSIVGSTVQSYMRDSKDVRLKFTVDNTINGAYDAGWSATFYIIKNSTNNNKRVLVGSVNCTGGDENTEWSSPNLASYLTNSTDNIIDTVIVEVDNGIKQVSRSIRFICVYAVLNFYNSTENLNLARINRPVIQYVTRYSADNANLIVSTESLTGGSKVDYSSQGTNVTSNTSAKNIALNAETNGGIRVINAVMSINGGSFVTDILRTEAIFVTNSEKSGTFFATRPILDAKQHEDATIYFGVYSRNNETASVLVEIVNNNNEVTAHATINARCGRVSDAASNIEASDGVTSSYTFSVPSSNYTIKLTAAGITRTIRCTAVESNFGWEIAKNPELYLNAKGKSNNQADAKEWINNGYGAIFKNVEFEKNGWNNSESLRLTGEAQCIIPISPFYDTKQYSPGNLQGGGFLATGRTFITKIKTTDVSNIGGKIVQCWDEETQCGFYVRPDSIYARIGRELVQDYNADQRTSVNNRRFSAGKEIEIAITVEPLFDGDTQKEPEVTLYVNGEIAGVTNITSTNSLSQNTPKNIIFGGEGATTDVYYIEVYNRCLSSEEIHHNYVMLKNSQEEMREEYTKNNYDFNSLEDAIAYCKAQSLKPNGNCSIVVTTDIRRGITSTSNISGSPTHNQVWFIYFKNGKVDAERSIKYVAKAEKGLRIRVQGTSTAAMPEKNLRYDAKGEVYAIKWNELAGDWYEINDENIAAGYVSIVKKLAVVTQSKDDIPCKLVTTKTNYNESTATRNLPNALWVNDAINALYDNNPEKYGDILTPPQKVNRKVRQSINGVPALQYYYNLSDNTISFSGKVDIITDKSNQGVFGFNDEGDYSVELRSNTTAVCNFHTSDLTNACQFTEAGATGNDDLEYRYPDADTKWNAEVNGKVIIGPNTPIQRLWDFVMNCSPLFVGYEFINGQKSSHDFLTIRGKVPYITDTNESTGNRTYTVEPQVSKNIFYANVDWDDRADTIENRKLKFFAEAHKYIVVNSFVFNGLVSRTHLWTDQRAKNQFFTHYKGDVDTESGNEILRLLPYDIDTSWRGDNDSRLRYDYTRTYEDQGIYDDAHSINGKVHGSTLWWLMDACFGTEYNAMYFDLCNATVNGVGKNFYSLDVLQSYYKDNQVEAYCSSIYNADTNYKYRTTVTDEGGTSDQRFKAHGSAIEDLDWWMKGRLNFIGGQYYTANDKVSDYASKSITINIKPNNNFDEVILDVTTYERSYTNWLQGTAFKAKGYSEGFTTGVNSNEHQMVNLGNVVTSASDSRIYLYGYNKIRNIVNFYDLYVVNFETSDTLNFEELNIGIERSDYENDVFTGFGAATYGSCKKVDCSNCTVFEQGNFTNFPILEELKLKGCSRLTSISLPVTGTLKKIYYPANLLSIHIDNKPNLKEISIEDISKINNINITKSSNEALLFGINVITNIYGF